MKTLFLILTFKIGFFSILYGQTSPTRFKEDIDVFLLIGQSNMQGVAPITESDTLPLKNVFLLTSDYDWEPARNLTNQGMNRYSSVKKNPKTLYGPAYSFGRKIEQLTNKKIGIISNARGATRIEWWQKGFEGDTSYHLQSDFDLYENAVLRVKETLERYPNARLKAILWHQGEANNHPNRSVFYLNHLKKLISQFRIYFQDPHLPFIVGEVGTWNKRGEQINPILNSINNYISNTYCVNSFGLTSIDLEKNDPHFDNLSQKVLGERYAIAVAKLAYSVSVKGVQLFSEYNFKGKDIILTEGSYGIDEINDSGLLVHEIKSIKCDPGFLFEFISEKNKSTFNSSQLKMEKIPFNVIKVKSTKIVEKNN